VIMAGKKRRALALEPERDRSRSKTPSPLAALHSATFPRPYLATEFIATPAHAERMQAS
jgi:hypothetical protein